MYIYICMCGFNVCAQMCVCVPAYVYVGVCVSMYGCVFVNMCVHV